MAERPVDEQEWRDVRLNQQRQAVLLERFQLELESHLKEAGSQARLVARYVMDPEDGVVVHTQRLQDSLEALARTVSAHGAEAGKVRDLERRLGAVEKERAAEAAARIEDRRWRLGTVIIPLVAGLGGAVLGAAIAAWLG